MNEETETRGKQEDQDKGREGSPPWVSIALYVMGVLTGILVFAIFSLASGRGPFARVDSESMQLAARTGTLDAIATLQAQANQPPTPEATPTIVPNTAFDLRDANREGDPNAPVVMVEFSDFQ